MGHNRLIWHARILMFPQLRWTRTSTPTTTYVGGWTTAPLANWCVTVDFLDQCDQNKHNLYFLECKFFKNLIKLLCTAVLQQENFAIVLDCPENRQSLKSQAPQD